MVYDFKRTVDYFSLFEFCEYDFYIGRGLFTFGLNLFSEVFLVLLYLQIFVMCSIYCGMMVTAS